MLAHLPPLRPWRDSRVPHGLGMVHRLSRSTCLADLPSLVAQRTPRSGWDIPAAQWGKTRTVTKFSVRSSSSASSSSGSIISRRWPRHPALRQYDLAPARGNATCISFRGLRMVEISTLPHYPCPPRRRSCSWSGLPFRKEGAGVRLLENQGAHARWHIAYGVIVWQLIMHSKRVLGGREGDADD